MFDPLADFWSFLDSLSFFIALAALIFARRAVNQMKVLRARLDLLEAAAPTSAGPPPIPTARIDDAPRMAPSPRMAEAETMAESAPPIAPATPPPLPRGRAACCHACGTSRSRLRGAYRHPLGGLGRRIDAGARRLLHGALFHRTRFARPRRAHAARRLVRAGAACRGRMDPAQGEHLRHRGAADRQHSRHPHRRRHRRRLRHRLRGLCAV